MKGIIPKQIQFTETRRYYLKEDSFDNRIIQGVNETRRNAILIEQNLILPVDLRKCKLFHVPSLYCGSIISTVVGTSYYTSTDAFITWFYMLKIAVVFVCD